MMDGLDHARRVAASLFAAARDEPLAEQKRRRRRVTDELLAVEELWDRLSPDAYVLMVDAAERLGFGDIDMGAVASVARQTLIQRTGPRSYRPFHRAAIPLIAWWEREHSASPLTKYDGDDAGSQAPSRPVAFLAAELAALSGETGASRMVGIAYRCWQVHKSNGASRSNSVPD